MYIKWWEKSIYKRFVKETSIFSFEEKVNYRYIIVCEEKDTLESCTLICFVALSFTISSINYKRNISYFSYSIYVNLNKLQIINCKLFTKNKDIINCKISFTILLL